jgi:hypothetical protein
VTRVLIVLLLLLAAACSSSPSGREAVPPGELDRLRAELAALPGVERASIDYSQGAAVTGLSRLSVRLDVPLGNRPALREPVTRLLWESRIAPLDVINYYMYDGGQEPVDEAVIVTSGDRAAGLRESLGPRPVP